MSVLEQILEAIRTRIDASGKPAGVVVSRGFTVTTDLTGNDGNSLPIGISIMPAQEATFFGSQHLRAPDLPLGSNHNFPITMRAAMVAINIRGVAASGESPDQTLDPVVSWVVAQMVGPDRTLGGLAVNVVEHQTVWTGQNGQDEYGRVQLQFQVVYLTKSTTRDSRPGA